MKHPKLHFEINKTLDKWKISEFLKKENVGGYNFQEMILNIHPKLKKEKVPIYTDKRYKYHKSSMTKTANTMQKDWIISKKTFFKLTNETFKNTPWPKGEYIAYLSISPPFPRFLSSKTFQIPYTKSNDWIKTVKHEMLHFIFYEFVRKKYTPELNQTIEEGMNKLLSGKFTIPIWDISEIFNAIILKEKPYKDHKSNYKKLKKIWKKSGNNIDKFLEKLEA